MVDNSVQPGSEMNTFQVPFASKDTKLMFMCMWPHDTNQSDVADVVSHCGVSVLQLQRRFSVTEQHLRSRVTGPPALLKLLNTEKHRHQSVLSSLLTHTPAVTADIIMCEWFCESSQIRPEMPCICKAFHSLDYKKANINRKNYCIVKYIKIRKPISAIE